MKNEHNEVEKMEHLVEDQITQQVINKPNGLFCNPKNLVSPNSKLLNVKSKLITPKSKLITPKSQL